MDAEKSGKRDGNIVAVICCKLLPNTHAAAAASPPPRMRIGRRASHVQTDCMQCNGHPS